MDVSKTDPAPSQKAAMTATQTPTDPAGQPGPTLHRPQPAVPLTPEEQHLWTTIYVAETCRASEASVPDRVDRAYDLAEDAVDTFRFKMDECRPAADADADENPICPCDENDANKACCGV
jgi:hypothetical protein